MGANFKQDGVLPLPICGSFKKFFYSSFGYLNSKGSHESVAEPSSARGGCGVVVVVVL